MPRGISRLFRNRPGSAPALMVFLLAAAGLAGDSALVSTLRGFSTAREADQSPTLGYYEGLINPAGRQTVGDPPGPPPGWLPFGGEATGIVEELPTYLRWQMKPNLDVRWNGTVFQTSSSGFRTPEVALEKPAGTYRVLVFGSSNTMGYGINNDEMYTRHLERFLNAWMGPSRRVEVVNLAVAGDSPTRRLERMRKEAGRWNADWLLCDASALDAWLEDNHIHEVLKRGLPIPFPFVQDAVRRSGATAADSDEVFRDRFRGEAEALVVNAFAAWRAEAARLQIPLTVVILPRGDSKGKSTRVFNLMRSLCIKNELDFIDMSSAFDQMEIDEFRISEWDKHPNARGHQVMFEALRDAILRRGELPGLSPPRSLREDGRSLASSAP